VTLRHLLRVAASTRLDWRRQRRADSLPVLSTGTGIWSLAERVLQLSGTLRLELGARGSTHQAPAWPEFGASAFDVLAEIADPPRNLDPGLVKESSCLDAAQRAR
jgi:hypothetical protein